MSKPSGNQTVTNTPDKDTLDRNRQIWNVAVPLSNQPYTQYAGPTTAGVSGQTTQSYNNLGGVAGTYQNLGNMGQDLYSRLSGAGQGLLGQVNGDPTYRQAGQTGAAALGGDQHAISQLMNPYQQGVIDQVKSQYGDLNDMAQRGINDQFTKAGAFGGSRQGVASGVASSEIAKGLGQQIAGLEQSGFNDAMNRAGSAANLGLGAGQLGAQLAGLGLQAQGQAGNALGMQGQFAGAQGDIYGQQAQLGDLYRQVQQQQYNQNQQNFNNQRDWGVRNLGILQSAAGGLPYGSTQSAPTSTNVLGSMAGGAATGGAIGGPIGAGIGAGVGLFGSLF